MSYIIMKYDDLLPETFNDFNQVAQYSIQHDLPVSMGVIGRGLENSNTLYKDNFCNVSAAMPVDCRYTKIDEIGTWHGGVNIWVTT